MSGPLGTGAGSGTGAVEAHEADTDPHGDRAYTDAELAALVDSAPGLLDTLNELAATPGSS